MLKFIVLTSFLSLGLGLEFKPIPGYNVSSQTDQNVIARTEKGKVYFSIYYPCFGYDLECVYRPKSGGSGAWILFSGTGSTCSNGKWTCLPWATNPDYEMMLGIGGNIYTTDEKNALAAPDIGGKNPLNTIIETINSNIEDYNRDLNQEWNDFQNKTNKKFQWQNKKRDEQHQKKIRELEERDQERDKEMSDFKKKLAKQYRGYMADILTLEVRLESQYQKKIQDLEKKDQERDDILLKFHQRLSIQENPIKI
jgi:hypothetical protein